jgi:hypothetical protein
MHDFGLLGSPGKPAKALPAFVLHTPDGRNGPGTNTVRRILVAPGWREPPTMRGVFCALWKFCC